jgi:hypothetical protein
MFERQAARAAKIGKITAKRKGRKDKNTSKKIPTRSEVSQLFQFLQHLHHQHHSYLFIEFFNGSLVPASNFPAASLKALGEMVANLKERSCKVVWVVIEVAVVDILGGDAFLDKRREIVLVGSYIFKINQKLKPKTYDALPM